LLHNEKVLLNGRPMEDSTSITIDGKVYTMHDIKVCVHAYNKKKEARQRRYLKYKK